MTRLLSRVRFLPLTIFAAALMLTVKIGDIWQGVDGLGRGAISIADARAQQPAPETEAPPAEGEPGDAAQPGEGEADAAAAGVAEELKDPTLLTQAEIDLLQKLSERREDLDARAAEMERREALLVAAETRIDQKLTELRALQATIEGLIKTYDEQQETKVRSLVKIYENMKPKDAARIFEELDIDTLLLVAERMKERKLAPVMAQMNPAKAKEVTVELARLRQLPTDGDDAGG